MKIIKTDQVEHQHIFGLIVGSSGSGKTTLAKTLDHNKTIIFSAESGLLSLKDASIDVIEIDSKNKLLEAFTWLNSQDKYENLFIDSLTEIGQMIFNELKPNYSKSQMFGLYDEYATTMTKFLKALRDYKKINIFCTALDAITKKDFEEYTSIDLIQKSLASKLPSLFDEVFYLSIIEKDEQKHRVLLTDNKYHNFLKDRSGKLNEVEKPDLTIITSKIFKGEN